MTTILIQNTKSFMRKTTILQGGFPQKIAGLLKYKNKSYYESHRNIQFDTIYEERTYRVFAAFSVQAYNEEDKEFKYYAFVDMKEKEEFNTYIEQVMQKSYYQDEIPVFGDELLTLSTCESGNNEKRFVVMAKVY